MPIQTRGRLGLGRTGVSVLGLVAVVGCAGNSASVGSAELVSRSEVAPAAARGTVARAEGTSTGVHQNAPTYYKDVLPVLAANCIDCHQPQGMNLGGMVAPMSFTTYESTAPWARVMALRVTDGRMPPWHAHPMHKGTFVGERYLAEDDKRTIVAWAEAGAPAGNPSDAPQLSFGKDTEANGSEWWIGEPHLVMEFAEPYFVADDIKDLNVGVNLRVPLDKHTQPRWIKASEMRAGSEHVHHICGEPFGCIAPGWDPYVYPDGYAMLLPTVEEIRLGMHYNKPPGPGTGFHDTSRAAVIFYEDGDVIRHMVRRSVLSVGENFVIPAGHPDFTLTREFEFSEDTYILSVTPHMHYRGKKAKYELKHPDGRIELLLYVPEYHFEWQRMYVFRDPPVAPAGSKLLWTATWDNSADNPYNPDPTRDVPYGLPTEDEMGNGWLDYTPVAAMHHVVGRDPIPADLLEEVTRQLNAAAGRPQQPVVDGRRVEVHAH
jgi:hypothetical protein